MVSRVRLILNNNAYQLLSSYTVLSSLHIYCLVLTILWYRIYYSHFINEKTERDLSTCPGHRVNKCWGRDLSPSLFSSKAHVFSSHGHWLACVWKIDISKVRVRMRKESCSSKVKVKKYEPQDWFSNELALCPQANYYLWAWLACRMEIMNPVLWCG